MQFGKKNGEIGKQKKWLILVINAYFTHIMSFSNIQITKSMSEVDRRWKTFHVFSCCIYQGGNAKKVTLSKNEMHILYITR